MERLAFDHVYKTYPRAAGGPSIRNALLGPFARERASRPEPVRALTDLTFRLDEGDSLALMGANGSGKSTALKMVSQITYPTSGEIRVRGRVGALIEVGTGLHPELTGRENVYLYGRILGMSGRDVRARFDRIVDFSELGGAIDRPVKQYSSGMQLRLGYSLASHLEPDVLLVDEAVSVGDAGFQQACLQRTSELVQAGVTLIFVSHSPSLVAALCKKGLLLEDGRMAHGGSASEVAQAYLQTVGHKRSDHWKGSGLTLKAWNWDTAITSNGSIDLTIQLEFEAEGVIEDPNVAIGLTDGRPMNLVGLATAVDGYRVGRQSGCFKVSCAMIGLPLEPASYQVWLSVASPRGLTYILQPQPLGFIQLGDAGKSDIALYAGTAGWAPIKVAHRWSVE